MAKTLIALIAALCLAFPVAAAQSKSEPKKPARPAWTELTPAQQQVLAPLAGEWDKLDATRRKKWVAIAKNYPKMTPRAAAAPSNADERVGGADAGATPRGARKI